ncbi:MAG TPA: hypothetical protein VI357_11995 [Mycobacteriales bacterium]
MGIGLAVAATILVVLPLGAVWASHHWRDPPRSKWGIPPERLDAARNSPELVAYRRRIELGVNSGPREAAVNRAIAKGIEAPPELRAATYELAQAKVREIDAELPKRRLVAAGWLLMMVVMIVVGVVGRTWFLVLYSFIWGGRAVAASPYLLRKRRDRAVAAVAANA